MPFRKPRCIRVSWTDMAAQRAPLVDHGSSDGVACSAGPPCVVLVSGRQVILADPVCWEERVFDLQARVATALSLDVSRVALLLGIENLNGMHSLGDALGHIGSKGTPVTAVILEDVVNADDPQHVAEYFPDIWRGLFAREKEFMPSPDFIQCQVPEINQRMRGVLVDWIADVHRKYKMAPATLFSAVNLMDRYIELSLVTRRDLQLVGVSALYVASKVEEYRPMTSDDCVYLTANAYTNEQVLTMETSLLSVLGFSVYPVTVWNFLEVAQRANKCDMLHCRLIQAILELSLTEVGMIRYSPSHLTAAATLLSNEIFERRPLWPTPMVNYMNYSQEVLEQCVGELRDLLFVARHSPLQSVRRKFSLMPGGDVMQMAERALGMQ